VTAGDGNIIHAAVHQRGQEALLHIVAAVTGAVHQKFMR
jgi:hypothetical protein